MFKPRNTAMDDMEAEQAVMDMVAKSGNVELQQVLKSNRDRNNGMDSMSARVMAGSKPVAARSGFNKTGPGWLDSKPRS